MRVERRLPKPTRQTELEWVRLARVERARAETLRELGSVVQSVAVRAALRYQARFCARGTTHRSRAVEIATAVRARGSKQEGRLVSRYTTTPVGPKRKSRKAVGLREERGWMPSHLFLANATSTACASGSPEQATRPCGQQTGVVPESSAPHARHPRSGWTRRGGRPSHVEGWRFCLGERAEMLPVNSANTSPNTRAAAGRCS